MFRVSDLGVSNMAAWYQDNSRKTYVATYTNEKTMRAEVEASAKFGWVTQTMASSRKGQWTVSYLKDERARVRIQAEEAFGQVGEMRGKLVQAVGKVSALEAAVRQRFQGVRTETSNPTQLEQRLLKSIKELVSARQAAITQRNLVLGAYGTLQSAYEEAENMRVDVSHVKTDIPPEMAALRQDIGIESERLQRDRALQEVQEAVVKPVQDWQIAVGNQWGARSKIAKADQQLAKTQQSPAAGGNETQATSANAKTRSLRAERVKHEESLRSAETLVQQREAALVGCLQARDARMMGYLAR